MVRSIRSERRAFPSAEQLREDLLHMQQIGINSIRTYHVPPEWVLELTNKHDINVFVDIPWATHLCFLESAALQREARQAVEDVCRRGRAQVQAPWRTALAIEIPPNIVRWHGTRRVSASCKS